MAAHALRLADEQLEALDLLGCERVGATVDPVVEGSAIGNNRRLEHGNGLGKRFSGDPFTPIGALEHRAIARDAVQPRDHMFERQIHDLGVGHGTDRLLVQRLGAAVPEKGLGPGKVEDWWRSARHCLADIVDRLGHAIGPDDQRAVAGRAGHIARIAQYRISSVTRLPRASRSNLNFAPFSS